ncbi:hypothetical protein FP2506_14404 [Fulvimarina pelagi HTCC2506]|uniref:3-oxo-tetronate 4-phosphate decarboxylase n=1 Tax=Fulvimarina pelagi HTCC2506 TaxID=314231 RepID=Q0G449_9HYPH|nr:aldolase [Fulvimarina pelagi]EAU41632.1 hypothetical protein FP2506_14404 [Fulvimarina pelagi HTCC2506]
MSTDASLRESICIFAHSLHARGLTHGSTGNISARTGTGGLIVTPTGSSFRDLDPANLAIFDANGNQISGDKPTKELPLHRAFYDTRHGSGAVVHLHSSHSVALSMMPDADENNFLPPLTPYPIMLLGKVKLLPFFVPGDPSIGDAIRGLAGKRSAVMLANHGPVVSGKDLRAAVNAIEELEAGAKLALLTRGLNPRRLTSSDVQKIVKTFDVEWPD